MQTAAAQDSASLLALVDIILLAVEGACMIPLAIAYLYWVRRAMATDRASLYSIFLRVPRPTVMAIAKAEVRLLGEDADDDDEPAVCMLTWIGCHQTVSAHLPPNSNMYLLNFPSQPYGSCQYPLLRLECV